MLYIYENYYFQFIKEFIEAAGAGVTNLWACIPPQSHSGTSLNYCLFGWYFRTTYVPPSGEGLKSRLIWTLWISVEQTEFVAFSCFLSFWTLSWYGRKLAEYPRWADIIPIPDSGYPGLISRSGDRIFWKVFSSWYSLVNSRKFLNCTSKMSWSLLFTTF
jgi:hypothetical protein